MLERKIYVITTEVVSPGILTVDSEKLFQRSNLYPCGGTQTLVQETPDCMKVGLCLAHDRTS